ncbi:MAG: zinc metallopeptidase [Peptostreptococcaceae bacterium]|nr:zinc metallopeptidase [Peptostreptococcaceae bacterium]
MYFGMFDPTFIILIPAMIFAFFAQAKVKSAYKRYAGVRNRNGITGAQAARRILDSNGLEEVPIEITQGKLSDHYDPRKKVMRLSKNVYNDPSIASVSIAAHEAGHAIQDEKGYAALKIRNTIAPAVSVASNLSWPLLIIGIVITSAGYYSGGNMLFNIGIFLFVGVVIFHAVTLPVEFNASKLAVSELMRLEIIHEEERTSSKKVLSAAAMTYIAALAVAVANLLRILVIRGRN